MIIFEYNNILYKVQHLPNKLKKLGITEADIKIIEDTNNKPIELPDIEKCKSWLKILDLSTNLTLCTINNIDQCIESLKQYTKVKDIHKVKNCTIVDRRFIICPYLEEIPLEVKTLFNSGIYREKDGYSYIDITDCLIDYLLEDSSLTDKKLAYYIQSSPDLISSELNDARTAIMNGVKYVPYNTYIKYYRTHSKELIKKFFNLNEVQYKTIQKKFWLSI